MTQTQPQAAMGQASLAYKWKVLIVVIFGLFMPLLDTTVVNVAFQTLRQDFRASLNDAQWIISVYVLSLGITTPVAGFLADRYGSKRIYLAGLALFVVGSLWCGFAPDLWLLVGARSLQGVGAGLTVPLGTALLFGAFPPEEQGMALGLFGVALVVAPAVGPVLSGWIVDHLLWRWIFFINLPIGLVGIALAARLLRERRIERTPSLDLLGLLTAAVGFGALLYAASLARIAGPAALATWFGIGAMSLIIFTLVELFVAKEPLLDLRLYGKRTFLIASLIGYVSVIALFGPEFLLPIYLQVLRGRTALQTGTILLPLALLAGVTAPLAGRLYDRLGPRLVLVSGFGILTVNTWQLSQIQADTPIGWIVVLMVLRGIALGMTIQSTIATALAVVPQVQLARGSSLVNATRQVMIAIGVAALASVLASALSPDVRDFLRQTQESSGAAGASQPVGLCPAPLTGAGPAALLAYVSGQPASQRFPPDPLARRACDEFVVGFERTYQVTFYLALLALLLSALLPGWPGAWHGRRAIGASAAD